MLPYTALLLHAARRRAIMVTMAATPTMQAFLSAALVLAAWSTSAGGAQPGEAGGTGASRKPEKPTDPFADLPALWWQRETAVTVMDRLRRGVVARDSLRVPLVRLGPASRELATALLNDHFHDLRPWLRAEAAKEALRERFPYLGE